MAGAPRWSAEQTQTFKDMWADGATYTEIANATGVTRNAVAGKHRRLELPRRGSRPPQPKPKRKLKLKPREPAPQAAQPAPPTPRLALKPKPLWKLKPNQCRWGLNDGGPFLFCGAKVVKGRPYCAEHNRLSVIELRPGRGPVSLGNFLAEPSDR